jgi:microcystin-dependent protein
MSVQAMISGQWVTVADILPSGQITEFAASIVPSGWLLCDGSPVSRTVYTALFAAIGTAYGSGDNATTFNVPDLRGQFLRGVDGSAGVDPNKTTRVALKPGGNIGNNVGSQQPCATKQASNPFATVASNTLNDAPDHTHQTMLHFQGASGSGGAQPAGSTQTANPNQNHTHSVPVMTVVGGDSETRPPNVYLNYIIKI